jgi:hypothetical protein
VLEHVQLLRELTEHAFDLDQLMFVHCGRRREGLRMVVKLGQLFRSRNASQKSSAKLH